ncbi:MAG: selenocysteine-specific translation elongation factor [Acidimicrobiia bacterium]
MPVVGTAGHVDHGKSTLTLALSGRDPDRWKEEKDRGLTIDLGFAWTSLGGVDVSFVDVPGHERYSKNMLAGIEAIDVALLVVAADEGWMPQSEEHLAVLDLLDVGRAVVALTKVDRVDSDLVELATLEIEEHLQATSLAHAPIVGVSAISGEGLDALRAALIVTLQSLALPSADRPRMWIDRVFSAVGAGTIVTGTLLGGGVAVDDRLRVFPGEADTRVRGIQSHETTLDRVEPHRRVALNLGGVAPDDLERGSMLGRPGEWRTTDRVVATIRPARYVEEIPDRGAYHLHTGSGAWPVRLRAVDDGVAVLDLPTSLPLTMGDRFILRDTGRRLVVGGGRVLDPAPGRPRRIRPHLPQLLGALDADPNTRATALLEARSRSSLSALAADSGGGRPPDAIVAGDLAMTKPAVEHLANVLFDLIESYHRDHPLRSGLGTAEAASRLGIDLDTLALLVDRDERAEFDGATVRAVTFTGDRTPDQDDAWERTRARLVDTGPAGAPRTDELGLDPELIHALVRGGELVRISGDFVFLPQHVDELLTVVRSFEKPFTVSEFRDQSGLSRKYAVPFLEWSDRAGHTVRQGDARRAR